MTNTQHRPFGRRTLIVALSVLVPVLMIAPAPAEQVSSLSVGILEVEGSTVAVGGTIRFGGGDLSMIYAEDSLGDARPPGIGLDLGWAALHPLPWFGQIWLSLTLADGNADRPIAPPNAYSWPLRIGPDRHVWLGAGAPGTGTPPSTEWWHAICTTQSAVSMDCSTQLPTFPITSGVQWLVPIEADGFPAGSVIEPGYMNGGAISSFAWPPTNVGGTQITADTMESFPGYRVPGLVRFAIAPEGTQESALEYDQSTTIRFENTAPMTYSDVLEAPAEPGRYELHARSCWGVVASPVCVSDVTALTI